MMASSAPRRPAGSPPASCYTVEGTGTDAALVLFSRRLYLFSIYWLMCSVSGTNVPAPFTAIEMAFSLAVVLGGFLVTAYVIGTFTGALSHLSAASNMEHQKRDFIEQFLRRKQIPKPLRRQVAQFFEFSGFDDEATDTLSELPVSLRLQLDLVINRDLFLKVPFFKNCETSFLIVMVPRIHREYTWWGKTVVVEELFATGLHMLGRGFCKCTRNGVLETLLTTNDFFGEESLLSDTPSPSTITTVTQCQFMVLDTTNFAEMLELYPNMQRALKRYDMMKAKTANKLSRERREWTEKSRQLHRVRLEKIRTGHTMPAEALARLRHEISNMAEMIKAEQQRAAAARRSSPAGGGHFFMSRARRSSHPDGRIAAAAAVAAVTSASSAGLSSTSASSAKQADAAQPTVSFRGDDGARRC
jgi:CRP-like cAMP-binding protein